MSGIIEGKAWLTERRQFLQEELAKDPPEDERNVLQSELAAVEQELASKRRRWWRRFLGGFQDGTWFAGGRMGSHSSPRSCPGQPAAPWLAGSSPVGRQQSGKPAAGR